jgi:multiple sugar transport system ATP-binding protein
VMRDGVVVQCGPPLELFEHPADLFVATFLGSPPMAAVRGVIAERNGVAGLRIGSQFLRWPGLRDDHPQLCERDAVAVGIRPHGVSIDPDGCLEASIGAVEDVGHEIVVHAVMVADGVRPVRGGTAVSEDAVATLSVTAHQDVEVDAFRPVRLAVDTMSVHLFDLATGAALERAAATASADR